MAAHQKALIRLFIAVTFVTGLTTAHAGHATTRSPDYPTRIISLIPAVTEMLYAIGAGGKLVAVSSYDTFPPEVKRLPSVGALLDPNVERILSLRPDLVVVYGSQVDLKGAARPRAHRRVRLPSRRSCRRDDNDSKARRADRRRGEGAGGRRPIEQGLRESAPAFRDGPGRARWSSSAVSGSRYAALYASGGIGFLDDMLDGGGRDQRLCRRQGAGGAGQHRADSGTSGPT